VVAVIALVVLVIVVLVVLVGLAITQSGQPASLDGRTYQAMVELHRIRQRQEVTQLKSDIRRDGAQARRALRDDLRRLDKTDWPN
jgi:hypothetical protein